MEAALLLCEPPPKFVLERGRREKGRLAAAGRLSFTGPEASGVLRAVSIAVSH